MLTGSTKYLKNIETMHKPPLMFVVVVKLPVILYRLDISMKPEISEIALKNDYKSNIDLKRYNFRSNVDVTLNKSLIMDIEVEWISLQLSPLLEV